MVGGGNVERFCFDLSIFPRVDIGTAFLDVGCVLGVCPEI